MTQVGQSSTILTAVVQNGEEIIWRDSSDTTILTQVICNKKGISYKVFPKENGIFMTPRYTNSRVEIPLRGGYYIINVVETADGRPEVVIWKVTEKDKDDNCKDHCSVTGKVLYHFVNNRWQGMEPSRPIRTQVKAMLDETRSSATRQWAQHMSAYTLFPEG